MCSGDHYELVLSALVSEADRRRVRYGDRGVEVDPGAAATDRGGEQAVPARAGALRKAGVSRRGVEHRRSHRQPTGKA